MSRQINFRVWDNHIRRFRFDKEFYLSLAGVPIFYQSNPVCCFGLDQKRFTCQQSIGLKDINDKEIFDGDIIQFDLEGIVHGPERECGIVAEVWYCTEDATWVFGKYHYKSSNLKHPLEYDWYYSLADRIDRKTIKVIGNIFENPELIK